MSEFGGLNRAQIDALANVAFGGEGAGCHPRTLAALERRGLIESYHDEIPGPLGVLRIKKWLMPLSVHVVFCEWCASKDGER